ncbi:MAG: N4-(beta-N-acetylglucosaminyl)-L-asparaginase [Blastocatellia bacterium]|nr:N4-(beta-N-acetylglucosaminyl)-L-asparaginase [Blastocatellia bacterium]
MKRRDFMIGTGAAGLVLASKPATTAAKRALGAALPTMLVPAAVKPLVISSANGNRFKNGGPVTCVQKAFTMITKGEDVLDSVIAGVNIVELDPLDDSVGYGGLPNAEVWCNSTHRACTDRRSRPAPWPRSKVCALLHWSPRQLWSRPITI